jgi:tRNA(adenine34) deaminase
VAVVDDAMVVRAHDRVQQTNDPTAHAVVVALRETARKLGTVRLADATIFATQEPCPMCVGALLASDIDALVYAAANDRSARPGRSSSSHSTGPPRRDQDRQRHPTRRGRTALSPVAAR